MEIDTLPTAHAGPGTAASATKIEGVLSMEEFERGYQAEHAANKAAKLAPGPKLRAAPVAIGAHSSKHTQDLHQKYQKLNISQPVFKFEGSSDQGWKGQVGFPGLHEDLQDIKDDKIYSSKQQAKEELSGRALVILERLEKEGTVRKVESHSTKVSKYTVAVHDKAQKLGIPQPFFSYDGSTQSGWRATVSFPSLDEIKDLKDETYHANKSEAKESASKQVLATIQAAEADGMFQRFDKARGPAQQAPKEKEEPGENYVGQLLEFQRATKAPQPTYEDYAVGNQFTCLLKIDSAGSFGSLDARYTTKKTARREAARAAVEHFKSTGAWPEVYSELGGIKKKAKTLSGLPQLLTASGPDDRNPSIASSTTTSGSYPQQVARLAHTLSLPTPEWRFTPSEMDRDFHTVQCFFNGGGEHAGPIGEVRNVFGKKKAKDECARQTLEYLNEVYKERMAYGVKMMEGARGAEGVLAGALGRPRDVVDGEGKAKRARMAVGDGGEVSDGDEEEFADAMEEIVGA